MQKFSRLKKPEILILLVCLFGLMAAGYNLFFSQKEPKQEKQEVSVGSIKPMGLDIQVKSEAENNWNPVSRDSTVFNNDKVFTGQNSQAKVKLKNSEKLTIEPNSLVVIAESNEKRTIEFKNGGLLAELQKGSELHVKFKNKETKIKANGNSTLRFQSSPANLPQLDVLRGEASVSSSESIQAPQIIKANEKAEISDEKIVSKTLDISLVSPEPGAALWNQDKSVDFKWLTSQSTSVRIEISKSPDFNSHDTISKELSSTATSMKLPTPGVYFWRVRSTPKQTSEKIALSPVSSFSLQQLIAPRVGNKAEIMQEPNDKGLISMPVHFIWNDIIASDEYDIEISKDPQFKSFEYQKRAESTSLDVSDLPFGKFYWRVRSFGKGRESLLSNVGELNLIKKEIKLPVAEIESLKPLRTFAAEEEPPSAPLVTLPTLPPEDRTEKVEVKKLELEKTELLTFSKEKEKDFWIWLGLGENFLYYQQTVPSISGNFKFQNAQGPTLLLTSGFKATDKWGAEFSYKETPGKMNSSKTIKVDRGSFTWKTTTGEAFYYLDDPSSLIRSGFQYHVMPFMQIDTTKDLLEVHDNTLMTFSVGFQKNYRLKEKLRGEWMMRYQHPIMAGSTNGDSFSVSPELAFDGGLGVIYLYDDRRRFGLYWYGQYHQYQFKYGTGSDAFTGKQILFYSNVELRLGWEF